MNNESKLATHPPTIELVYMNPNPNPKSTSNTKLIN